MRLTLTIVGLETYAVVLAWVQSLGGVRTDEAKYLLNIPYPHPPLARWVMSLNEWCPYQEIFWRVALATLLVQAVWLVWDAARKLPRLDRLAICGMWLISGGLVLQAGSIMMAPLTALQALVFMWLLTRLEMAERYAGFVALLWLASLFTAYQIVLYLPIIFVLFWRMRLPLWQKVLYVLVPLALIAIYTLSNPLTLASIALAGTMNSVAGVNPLNALGHSMNLWMLGGSVLLSFAGTIAMMHAVSRRSSIGHVQGWSLLLSLVLVILYLALSTRAYYAILFTPLFVMGLSADPAILGGLRKVPLFGVPFMLFLTLTMILTVVIVGDIGFPTSTTPAHPTMQRLTLSPYGDLLISGHFGHEWQHESHVPIRRYRLDLLDDAQAVVCLQPCVGIEQAEGWLRLENMPVETWVRTNTVM